MMAVEGVSKGWKLTYKAEGAAVDGRAELLALLTGQGGLCEASQARFSATKEENLWTEVE